VIFVDTSAFAAAIASRDARHLEAVALLEAHGSSGLVTSNHVRGETWTFVNRRYAHRTAAAFLDMLGRTRRIEVVFVSHDLEERALRWLRRRNEREYSFVDATSFTLMKSLRINEALTFDGDFEAAGFTVLRA